MTGKGRYFVWNDALADHFFCPDVAQQKVYLFVTEEVLAKVGDTIGEDVADFKAAVRAGPAGDTRRSHCERALQLACRWRERDYPFPPYIAYLAMFVLAAGHEGDFDPRSYYPRLWELLDEDQTGTPPGFERMWELWEDLEEWSVTDKQGQLGIYEARSLGGKFHIGFPLAQTILTEEERRALPVLFADASLEPGRPPSNRELARALSIYGRGVLGRRTIRALDAGPDSFREGLLEAVADDFAAWDGTVPDIPGRRAGTRKVAAGLRICLALDRVSGRAAVTLRCRTRKELPDTGLVLRSPMCPDALSCEEFVPGWSSPLIANDSGAPFVPPPSSWTRGLLLTDAATGWSIRLHPARVRLFVEGTGAQLPGLVEELELPRERPFYIAFEKGAAEQVEAWAEASCDGWMRLNVHDGLPDSWALYRAERAATDSGLRSIEPRLGFLDRRTIRFAGGLPAESPGLFFAFAPPDVVLEGALPGDTVECDDRTLQLSGNAPWRFKLPPALPVDRRVQIAVKHAGDVIRRRSVALVSGSGWQLQEALVGLDGLGLPTAQTGIAGGDVPGSVTEPMPVDLLRTPGLSSSAPRIYFIGRAPGQIVTWPHEPLPSWDVVWAVQVGRRGRAVFCGTSLEVAIPLRARDGDREHCRLWHSVLWRHRKVISPPEGRPLRTLWRAYAEVARDA